MNGSFNNHINNVYALFGRRAFELEISSFLSNPDQQ